MYTQGRETTFASLQWLVKLAGNGKAIKKEFFLGSKMAGLRKLIVLVAWSQKNFACFYKHSRLRLLKVEQVLVNNRSLQNNSWRPSTFSPARLPCPAFLKTAAFLGWELVRLHWVFLSFLSLYSSFLSLFEMFKYGQNDIIMENCQILGFNKTDSVSSSWCLTKLFVFPTWAVTPCCQAGHSNFPRRTHCVVLVQVFPSWLLSPSLSFYDRGSGRNRFDFKLFYPICCLDVDWRMLSSSLCPPTDGLR